MGEKDFAKNLKECALSVWIDDDSSFGTFPIESIKCNVPVIGKVPNIIPEWMNDDNGIWVYDENQIADLVFNYIKNWMEDTLPENLLKVSDTLKDMYTIDIFEKATVEMYGGLFDKKLSKLNTIKENLEKTLEKNEN
jgi:glycosyltransferase involved in cell wall biosynthesis